MKIIISNYSTNLILKIQDIYLNKHLSINSLFDAYQKARAV